MGYKSVKCAALAHEEAVGGPFLGAEATTTFEPCPQEGFVRRLMFHWCNNDLRAGRTESSFEVNGGRLAEDEMRRLVAYAKRHGFLR